MKIPIAKPFFTEQDKKSVLQTLDSGWIVQGSKVAEFEKEWSRFTNVKNSIAVTSCTSALHLSLVSLGFGVGDKAIVPAFTWISTANVVEHQFGEVIFCDIDLDTFNLSIDELQKKMEHKPKTILPVHLFGLSADMERIKKISKGVHLVEDAACGFGAKYNNKHVGSFGNTGCFSFHPRKSITTGEGGMITTNDDKLAEKLRQLRDHGASSTDFARHSGSKPYLLAEYKLAGYNQRMTDLQASLAINQLKRGNEILNERKKIAFTYMDELSDIDWLSLPEAAPGFDHGYQSFPCLYGKEQRSTISIEKISEKRNHLMVYLQEHGISTRPATHAVHMLEYYAKKYSIKPTDFPNAYFANECSISLPLFNGMKESEQEFVISKIKKFNH